MPLAPSMDTLIRNGVRDILASLDLGCPVLAGLINGGPDAVIGIMTYPAGNPEEELSTGHTIIGAQVRIRAAARDGVNVVSDRRQAVLDALTWTDPTTVGGWVIGVAWRETASPMVADSDGRTEVFDSYYLRSDRLGLIA